MKKLIFIVLSFFLGNTYVSAQSRADSMEKVAKKQTGSARVDTWTQLAVEWLGRDNVKARHFAQQAIDWSVKNKYPQGEFLGNLFTAMIYGHSGFMNEGRPYLDKALQIAITLQDSVLMARAWNLKGDYLREVHDFAGSLAINEDALRIFSARHDTTKMCNTLNRMALAYGGMHLDADEIRIHHQLLELASQLGDLFRISASANNIAAVHFRQKNYDEAVAYFNQGLQAARKAGNKKFETAALLGLGNVAMQTGKLQKALKLYEQCVEIDSANHFISALATDYEQIAVVYRRTGNWDLFYRYSDMAGEMMRTNGMFNSYVSALMNKAEGLFDQKRYNEALAVAQLFYHLGDSLHDIAYMTKGSLNLARYYQALEDYRQSSRWFEQHFTWRDSLDELEKSELARELESRYQLKEMKNANTSLQNVNAQQQHKLGVQQLTITAILIIGALVVIIAVLFFLGVNRLRRVNEKLAEQNNKIEKQAESLRDAIATKDKFFSIVAHDLKNPFAGLMNLSLIMNEEFDNLSPAELREMITIMSESSKGGYALLENLLEWSRSQTGVIEIHTTVLNLADLAQSELEKQQLAAHNKNIKLHFDIPQNLQTKADENMYRLIIRNLVSNAIKFTPASGEITVFGELKDGLVEISVHDTGIGMNEATKNKLFRQDVKHTAIGTANEKGTGLGLLLCKEFVEQQQGKIWVDSEPGKGSTFRFNLPVL